MENLNIVQLIENNPLTRLGTGDYQSRLVNKIRDRFNGEQQQLFVSSFYTYLNYDQHKDFVIDLGDVWKWCGFVHVDPAKRLLMKEFKQDVDYQVKSFAPPKGGAKSGAGGHNKETIIMTVNTFKKFCLKARTSKADEIHDYFIGLEEVVHELVEEEAVDMVNKLKIKDQEMVNKLEIKDQEMMNLITIK